MIERTSNKWISLLPALVASVIDISVTIIHQPAKYWEGDLSQANEGNPMGAAMMENHVSGLFLICGIWLFIIVLLGHWLPIPLRKYFLLFVVIAHSYGASTWISPRYGYWWAMALILFNTIIYLQADEWQRRRIQKM